MTPRIALRSLVTLCCAAIVVNVASATSRRISSDSLTVKRLVFVDSAGTPALRIASSDQSIRFVDERSSRGLLAAGPGALQLFAEGRSLPVLDVSSSVERASTFELRGDAAPTSAAVSMECHADGSAVVSVGTSEQKSEILIGAGGEARVSSSVRDTMEARMRVTRDAVDAAWLAGTDAVVLARAATGGTFVSASTRGASHSELQLGVHADSGATFDLKSRDSRIALESAPGPSAHPRLRVACGSSALHAYAQPSLTRVAAVSRNGRAAQIVANAREAGASASRSPDAQWMAVTAVPGMLLGTLTEGAAGIEAISTLPDDEGKR